MLTPREFDSLALAINDVALAGITEAARDQHIATLAAITAPHVPENDVDRFFERLTARSRSLLVASRRKGGRA